MSIEDAYSSESVSLRKAEEKLQTEKNNLEDIDVQIQYHLSNLNTKLEEKLFQIIQFYDSLRQALEIREKDIIENTKQEFHNEMEKAKWQAGSALPI